MLVAGSGFEPEPPGYEPGEVPFLYPAMSQDYIAIYDGFQAPNSQI